MNLPVFCTCGHVVEYPDETRCEACWADAQINTGKTLTINTLVKNEHVQQVPRCEIFRRSRD
jgi:hypothetical protein